ncbi:MAG: hypothetical protein HOP02_16635 [Methylococcaceae bacterium]|nr:hypothetical protein [Methylococcaceae bacterium]
MKTVLTLSFAVAFLANVNGALADIKTDSETILNWAEQKYPDALPTHQPTKTESQWLYRFYLNTNLYTGINTQNNNVYYITGEALKAGKDPVLFDSIPNALKLATPSAGKACDASKLPAGHTATQIGNVLKITTNGCIPEPLDDLDYCPPKAIENGISLKTTQEVTVTVDNIAEPPIKVISCTKNVSPDAATPTIELDVCYSDTTMTPPVNAKTQGKIVYEQVADCLNTDATTVTDIFNDEFWFNPGDGFVKLTKRIFN